MAKTKLQQLYEEQRQSAWLDNLKRGYITSGELQRWVDRGIRGITSNPTIFAKAIEGAADYDDQFRSLVQARTSIDDAYWDMVIDDIREALRILRPVHDSSGGEDGFVSIEVAPGLARDTEGSILAARQLHERISQPNLYVKIPGTAEGIPAIRQMVSEGRNINITLIFSLSRYDEVIEAYLSGLEAYDGDPSTIRSVASFFVSRVDTEADRRLPEGHPLRGKVAVANAKLAYRLFRETFAGDRWDALAARGARLQRPLWASTSTKNPAYSDTLYVDELVGPDTVNTLAQASIDALHDHGDPQPETITRDVDGAQRVIEELAGAGIDYGDLTDTLEREGVGSFERSYRDCLASLDKHAGELTG